MKGLLQAYLACILMEGLYITFEKETPHLKLHTLSFTLHYITYIIFALLYIILVVFEHLIMEVTKCE